MCKRVQAALHLKASGVASVQADFLLAQVRLGRTFDSNRSHQCKQICSQRRSQRPSCLWGGPQQAMFGNVLSGAHWV